MFASEVWQKFNRTPSESIPPHWSKNIPPQHFLTTHCKMAAPLVKLKPSLCYITSDLINKMSL